MDRAADRRGDALIPQLLDDAATKVVTISDGRALVEGDPARLLLRSPQPGDRSRLAMFLGEADDVRYVAVVLSPDEPTPFGLPAGPRPPGSRGGGSMSADDRGPERRPDRRPVAMTAMSLTIVVMAYLTYKGANAGPPKRRRCLATTQLQQSTPARLR